jgi:hypothetical protein
VSRFPEIYLSLPLAAGAVVSHIRRRTQAVSENRELRETFGKATGDWRKLHHEELQDL